VEDDETREDLYAEVWRRLELDANRLSELERRRDEGRQGDVLPRRIQVQERPLPQPGIYARAGRAIAV
jgi:hypothetical protein